jgi:uncharacterized protein YpmB
MFVSPAVELARDLIQIFGIPAIIAAVAWVAVTYEQGQAKLNDIHANSAQALTDVANVKQVVDVMQSNHLKHVQEGVEGLNKQGEKQIELLTSLDKNIAVMTAVNAVKKSRRG